MRKTIAALGTMALLTTFCLSAAQGQPTKRFDERTQTCRILTMEGLRDGRQIFRTSCKACHSRDAEQGAAFLYTESKTMRGWNRVFAKRYPECAKEGAWQNLSQEELLKLNDYLYANAYDSSNPYCYV